MAYLQQNILVVHHILIQNKKVDGSRPWVSYATQHGSY